METNDGKLFVIGGASRSGKTAWTRRETEKTRRVFAWDPEDQWAQLKGWRRVTSRADLMACAMSPAPQKIAFVAGGALVAEFAYWASAVMYAGRYVAPIAAIAEELADVTTPAKAPGSWGILLRRGLKRGITIYAISQRWQEADKTAIGNASEFILFRQNGPKAAKYLESMTGISADQIPTIPLEFVKFDPTTGKTERGKMIFKKQ